MKKRIPVSKIMTANVKTVNLTNTLKEVHQLLDENNIHHVPVVSGEKLIGMLSKTDLERISFVNSYGKDKVGTQMYDALDIDQVMTKDVVSIQKDESVLSAAKILAEKGFHALPVIENASIVGIVTTKDLLDYLIDLH